MKKKLFSIFTLLVLATVSAQDFKTPVDYLNYISTETDAISKNTWMYTQAVAHSKSAHKIEASRKALVKSIQNSAKKFSSLQKGYKGDTEYRDQLLAYLSISENYINDEYGKIIDLQEVAEQSYDFMEAYITARDLVNQKINDEIQKLNANQKLFGKKYNVNITEDNSELGRKMKTSNEVFKYHTQLYLIFFKVNVTDMNLMNAIKRKDLNAIQQNASSLEIYADEGLEKLKNIAAYHKDASLVNATKKAVDFYKKEALDMTPKVLNFLMLNQKVEESQATMEAKAEKERTIEEVQNFNNLVKGMNKEVAEFNKLNTKFFQEKSAVVKAWEQAGTDFISKHVPKD